MAEDTSPAAVYVSWLTFRNSIESLTHGVPNQIDRTTFPGLSGGVQSQLFAGLKFLGLVNDDGRPTPSLHELAVKDEGARKEKLKSILEQRYSELFGLDLVKTTPKELGDRIGSAYNVSGDTKEKAIRFFLSAVAYVGVPVSRFLAKPTPGTPANGSRPARTRRTPRAKAPSAPPPGGKPGTPTTPSGTSRVIQLISGGTLTLTATLDLFALSSDDRTFVFDLIDKLEGYATNNPDQQK